MRLRASWIVLASTTLLGGPLPVLAVPGSDAFAPPQDQAGRSVIRQAIVTMSSAGTLVTIEARGTLPEPRAGTADTPPPRIFLDFPGVTPEHDMRITGAGAARSIRIALNTAAPPLTRVVVDLRAPGDYTVDASARTSGRVSILIKGATDRRQPPSAPTPSAAKVVTPPPVAAAPPATPSNAPAPRSSKRGSSSVGAPAAPRVPPPATTPSSGTAALPSGMMPSNSVPTTTIPPVPPLPPVAEPPGALRAPDTSTQSPTPSRPPDPKPNAPPVTTPAAPAVTSPAAPPVTTSAAPRGTAAPRTSPSSESTAAKAPAEEIRRYVEEAADPLRRLQDLRPLLVSIDRRAALPADSLELAIREFRDIRADLLALQPSRAMRVTHDTLFRACALALQATALRLDGLRGGSANDWNAASAAAGALLLLDRARADLGQPNVK